MAIQVKFQKIFDRLVLVFLLSGLALLGLKVALFAANRHDPDNIYSHPETDLIWFYLLFGLASFYFIALIRNDGKAFVRFFSVFTVAYLSFCLFIMTRVFSEEDIRYRLEFLKDNGRAMSFQEITLYKEAGDAYLADEEYCRRIGGSWRHPYVYCDVFDAYKASDCFPHCVPPEK
jgi:hypothetical protein